MEARPAGVEGRPALRAPSVADGLTNIDLGERGAQFTFARVPRSVWDRLDTQRGRRRTIAVVAVARELTGFCWALANAA